MKTRILFLFLLLPGFFFPDAVLAEDEKRDLPSFSEISLRVSGRLILEQGNEQSVRIVAKSSTLETLITEVKGRSLVIRFQNNTFFNRPFNAGNIEIYVTVPEINALAVSGSGDIVASERIKSRILDLTVSGSGDITLEDLVAERVKTSISGSGNIHINQGGLADELTVNISGSGNLRAPNFEAKTVEAKISGSGSCSVHTNGSLNARVAGSGNVSYKGNPQLDTSVFGSGKIKKL